MSKDALQQILQKKQEQTNFCLKKGFPGDFLMEAIPVVLHVKGSLSGGQG
jgi:hypothetical protein